MTLADADLVLVEGAGSASEVNLRGTDIAPDFTVLAAFDTKAACDTAAAGVIQALSTGQDQKVAVCLSSDSLDELAKSNGLVK